MENEQQSIQDNTYRFLANPNNITAALATADKDGQTHTAVMYYFVDKDFTFNFLTATDTQKYKNLLQNQKTSLTVGFGPEYITVQAQGEAVLLEKGSEAENFAIANLKKKLVDNGCTWPIFQLSDYDDNAIAVFKFTPSSLRYLNLEKDNGLPVTDNGLQKVI